MCLCLLSGRFHLHLWYSLSFTSSILESYVHKVFTHISFAVLKQDDCLSVQVPFQLPVQVTVQLLLELGANLLDQHVNELEFELSRMQMKRAYRKKQKRDAIDTTNQLRQKCTILSLLVPPSLYNVIFFKKEKNCLLRRGTLHLTRRQLKAF